MTILLEKFNTPFETAPFDKINQNDFLPALKEAIKISKNEIDTITQNTQKATFENTIIALEQSGALVERISGILFNLNSCETNPELQKITREASPLLSEYGNDIMLNKQLFERVKAVFEDKERNKNLDIESQSLLTKSYKSFSRNGANLNENDQEKLRQIDKELSEKTLQFSENILNETNAYSLEILENDVVMLAGLPDYVLEMAQATATEKGKKGYVFTLHQPSYLPFMTYAENRDLRKKMFLASASKAFQNNENDNQENVKSIVALRHKRANLLGYATHADFVLEERMAGTPQKVQTFLNELLQHAKPVAEKQMQELTEYAKNQGFTEEFLQRWDYAFYSEKLKKEKYQIDDEALKPYFQLENVVLGVFEVAKKLYGLSFVENKEIAVYHQDVKAYEVLDEQNKHIAVFYADFFPREGKKGGAWMTSFREQRGEIRPLVSIVCNFTKPTPTKPSLLTFDEVTTLFHEFGHALHGMLANGKYQSTSGTNVYWDFVELPSQILENWCYEKECLDLFAKHYQTNEPISQDFIQKITDSANFMEGYATMRQLSFGLLDMAWYGKVAQIENVATFEREISAPTDLFPAIEGTNMSCAFAHIFSGGYSAGYYSYKWAEVLDADAFEYFKEKGIFNKEIADLFKENVLSKGSSEHPMVLYKRFRGQEPSPKALLKRSGLLQN